MDILEEEDLDVMMERLESDETGFEAHQVISRLDSYCEEIETMMAQVTDATDAQELQAMLDTVKATRQWMPVVWSQVHGRELPDAVEVSDGESSSSSAATNGRITQPESAGRLSASVGG